MGQRRHTSWFGGTARLLSVVLLAGIVTSAVVQPVGAVGVTPVLVSIAVTPPVGSISVGQTEQFTATGTYSNLSTKNLTGSVTWSSSNTADATVSSGGLASGVAAGLVTITATDPATKIPGTAALTVAPAVLTSIAVTPAVESIGVGQTEQFTATGTYSNLGTKNLTTSVTW